MARKIICTSAKFQIGTKVEKVRGSCWRGRVVGFYSATLTEMGYAVESDYEPGNVQVYPEVALRAVEETSYTLRPDEMPKHKF